MTWPASGSQITRPPVMIFKISAITAGPAVAAEALGVAGAAPPAAPAPPASRVPNNSAAITAGPAVAAEALGVAGAAPPAAPAPPASRVPNNRAPAPLWVGGGQGGLWTLVSGVYRNRCWVRHGDDEPGPRRRCGSAAVRVGCGRWYRGYTGIVAGSGTVTSAWGLHHAPGSPFPASTCPAPRSGPSRSPGGRADFNRRGGFTTPPAHRSRHPPAQHHDRGLRDPRGAGPEQQPLRYRRPRRPHRCPGFRRHRRLRRRRPARRAFRTAAPALPPAPPSPPVSRFSPSPPAPPAPPGPAPPVPPSRAPIGGGATVAAVPTGPTVAPYQPAGTAVTAGATLKGAHRRWCHRCRRSHRPHRCPISARRHAGDGGNGANGNNRSSGSFLGSRRHRRGGRDGGQR